MSLRIMFRGPLKLIRGGCACKSIPEGPSFSRLCAGPEEFTSYQLKVPRGPEVTKGWRMLSTVNEGGGGGGHDSEIRSDDGTGSVKAQEVAKFERMSSSWWDHGGQMSELHSMNRLRVPFIRDGLLQMNQRRIENALVPKPLAGLKILDIGCGGGILCEPLGRLGAMVKGIDPGQENITVATNHLPEDLRSNVSYECISIEDFVVTQRKEETYDAVVMSEVIEHVDNPTDFIQTATEVLKPGGSFFLTTLNRTMESWVGAIVAWEYVLRKLPVGTHDWKKFLTPEEIQRILKSCGLRTGLIHGMSFNPMNNSWKWSSQRCINYAVHAVKE